MKKTIERLKNYFGRKKKIEPAPECFIKVSRFECFCESPCNEYCHGYTKQKETDFLIANKGLARFLEEIKKSSLSSKDLTLGEITTITSTPKK